MKITKFNNREKCPAFFDMAGRFAEPDADWVYGDVFLIGDRAATYVMLHEWRKENPDRKLVVIDDLLGQRMRYAKCFPATWFLKDIADEIWVAEKIDEIIERPSGEALYKKSVWQSWYDLKKKEINIDLSLPEDVFINPEALYELYQLESFVTVQPLFDANYCTYRNASPSWWYHLCSELSRKVPVVILGAVDNMWKMGTPINCYPFWAHDLTALESLACIKRSRLHIGGQTGLSLWACIIKSNFLGLFENVLLPVNWYLKPFSFGGEIGEMPLGGSIPKIVKMACDALRL